MSDIELCLECGMPLPAYWPKGLCARCAFDGALDLPHEASPVQKREVLATAPCSPIGLFGEYELLEEIARGGMGVVYKARQRNLERMVAVKMILAGADAGKEFVQRFRTEASAAAILQHPNIVSIHDVGVHEGRHFFSMDYVEGRNLTQLVAQQPLPDAKAARYVLRIAEAIHYAHERGILHRDLKPSNVLIDTATDQPRITDFGLAKRLHEAASLTLTGQVLGSPNFMPPEQAGAKRGKVGRPSDVYALGGILYYLLTARAPFQADSLEHTITQVLHAEPIPPRLLNPAIPKDLDTVMLKCLEKEPSRRYQTAQELADELGRVLRHEPIRARPVGAVEKLARWCHRKPALAGAVALATGALLAGLATTSWQWRRAERNAESERVDAYFHRVTLAHRELSEDNVGRALQLLEQSPHDLRHWEWDYLKRLCQIEPVAFGSPSEVHATAFHPNGEQIAGGCGDGTVQVWDARTGRVLQTLRGHDSYVFSVAFRPPDGRSIVSVGADRRVRVWNVDSGAEIFQRPAHVGDFAGMTYSVAFRPDGRHLVVGADDGFATVWNADDGSEVRRLSEKHENTAVCTAFSPDGRLLATASWGGTVRIWDAVTYQLLRKTRGNPIRISAIAFSHDSRRLATASFDRKVTLWDPITGKVLNQWTAHIGVISGLAYSRDGRRLFSIGGEDKSIKAWDPLTSREVLNLRGHTSFGHCLSSSPDGLRLASGDGDGNIRIWDATPWRGDEDLAAVTREHGDEVWCVAFSSDGRYLASVSWTGTVQLWDAQSGELLRAMTRPAGAVNLFHAAFSPDSKRIVGAAHSAGVAVVTVWDPATGRKVGGEISEKSVPFFVTFDPTGQYLVREGPGHTVQVRDAQGGNVVGVVGRHNRQIWSMAFSPDGRRLATASNDGTVRLWPWAPAQLDQPGEPERILRVRGGGWGSRIAFSADGAFLAAGGEEHTVNTWDVKTGEVSRTLRGHSGDVCALAFSADGRWLASAALDTTIRIWDARSGKPLRKLRGHTGLVQSLAFSPDSRTLASGSRDHTMKLWDTSLWAEGTEQE